MEFEKIRDIIAKQLDIDPETITRESNLIEDLHADSLDTEATRPKAPARDKLL